MYYVCGWLGVCVCVCERVSVCEEAGRRRRRRRGGEGEGEGAAMLYSKQGPNRRRVGKYFFPGFGLFVVPRGRNYLLAIGNLISYLPVVLRAWGSVIGPISGGYFGFRPHGPPTPPTQNSPIWLPIAPGPQASDSSYVFHENPTRGEVGGPKSDRF